MTQVSFDRIRALIIDNLLVQQCIEPNPGPKINLGIQTCNCNGLGNINKLRRLLIKARNEVSKGGLVLL